MKTPRPSFSDCTTRCVSGWRRGCARWRGDARVLWLLTWIAGSRLGEAADWGKVHGLLGDVLMWLGGLHTLAGMLPWRTQR